MKGEYVVVNIEIKEQNIIFQTEFEFEFTYWNRIEQFNSI